MAGYNCLPRSCITLGDDNTLPFEYKAYGGTMAKKDTVRVVTRASDGSLLIRDFPNSEPLLQSHQQIGIDDCSTDLALRGLPVFKGLIGPMPEGRNIIRYETPEVFEMLTKEWGTSKPRRRTRRRKPEDEAITEDLTEARS